MAPGGISVLRMSPDPLQIAADYKNASYYIDYAENDLLCMHSNHPAANVFKKTGVLTGLKAWKTGSTYRFLTV